MQLSTHIEQWDLRAPIHINGYRWSAYHVNIVELSDGEHVGRGESTPVHYRGETAESARDQIELFASQVERGVDHESLLQVMPAGSARNAVDCAMWDLEAKRSARGIWGLTGVRPRSLVTAFTIGIDEPLRMAAEARKATIYPVLKVKLDATEPVERLAAVRSARPDARLTADANQAWTFDQLREWAPRLHELGVALIEQPLAVGADDQLEGYACPIPLCADESCQGLCELDSAVRRYQIINVKLDKAGGLAAALSLAREVRRRNRELLVSCMGGTSLGMAPGFVVAQLADYVELDGHTLLRHDRSPALRHHEGRLAVPDPRLWG